MLCLEKKHFVNDPGSPKMRCSLIILVFLGILASFTSNPSGIQLAVASKSKRVRENTVKPLETDDLVEATSSRKPGHHNYDHSGVKIGPAKR